MSCKHDCATIPPFPRPIENRPGLPTVAYRVGCYAEMREVMLSRLNADPRLANWTHRGVDDPGVALVESAAIVGDILTFYQQLYANEFFLRTARWRESVADLVRLLGYRLAPGLGGETRFALLAKGDHPVTVPKQFGFKAQLEGQSQPVVFEAAEALTAYPHLSSFNLFRPRVTPSIDRGTNTFQVVTPLPEGFTLNPGDRLLLGVADPSPANPAELRHAQIAVVDRTWESFGTTYAAIKGGIASLGLHVWGFGKSEPAEMISKSSKLIGKTPLQFLFSSPFPMPQAGLKNQEQQLTLVQDGVPEMFAFKLGPSYRHFGHNAPPQKVEFNAQGWASINSEISFARQLDTLTQLPADLSLGSTDLPLDATVDNISSGVQVVVEGRFSASPGGSSVRRWLVRNVEGVETRNAAWGALTGPSTVLDLDHNLTVTHGNNLLNFTDLRTINVHVVTGAGFRLCAEPIDTPPAKGMELDFFGTTEEAEALAGRDLLLLREDGGWGEAHVASVYPGLDPERQRFRRIVLDREVTYADFERDNPTVTVYGNVLAATQGKTEDEVALGNGDRSQIFQTFALPKSPLTYLLAPEETPPQHAELEVWVEGVRWNRVDSLFGAKPTDLVYVIREDAEGKSYLQFGDGKTGARLPSGVGNVVALYRTGSGATGPLKTDTTPQPSGRLPGLEKVLMPGPAVGGSQPESEETARIAAPGRMQSLDRLVSLADFEAEALALPGVLKARADWADPNGIPCVRLTVLTESESDADALKITESIAALNYSKGPRRHAVDVVQGHRRWVALALTAGYDARRLSDDVRLAILEALGVSGQEANGVEGDQGLFSLARRQFGQSAHSSQIIAAVQQVPGVVWVKLTASGFAPGSAAPPPAESGLVFREPVHLKRFLPLLPPQASLILPQFHRVIGCPADSILALGADQLNLTLTAVTAEETTP